MYHGEVTPEYSPSMADAPVFSPSMDFVLPIHSAELGSLPIFPAQPGQTAPAVSADVWTGFDMLPSMFRFSTGDDSAAANVAQPYSNAFGAAASTSTTAGQFQVPDVGAFQNIAPAVLLPGPVPTGMNSALDESSAGFGLPSVGRHDGGMGIPDNDMMAMWSMASDGFE